MGCCPGTGAQWYSDECWRGDHMDCWTQTGDPPARGPAWRDAWARYLPPASPPARVTSVTSVTTGDLHVPLPPSRQRTEVVAVTRKDHDWWDRVYKVMAMKEAAFGDKQPWMDGAPCDWCGSQFEDHRCCMEPGR